MGMQRTAPEVITAPMLLVISGIPAPQGSKTAQIPCGQDARPCPRCRRYHAGLRVTLREPAVAVKAWRAAVTRQARTMIYSLPPLTGPLTAAMTFTFSRPAAHYRTGKFAHVLRDDAPPYPVPRGGPDRGDISKLARSAEDALTDAGLWADDALVACYVRLAKVYVPPGLTPHEPVLPAMDLPAYCQLSPHGLDQLPAPGAVIRVWPA